MTTYADLSPYEYWQIVTGWEEPSVMTLNVGWLSGVDPPQEGILLDGVLEELVEVCVNPLFLTRGSHLCGFCARQSDGETDTIVRGNGEIRIVGTDGVRYAAPTLIAHYVESHNYIPPSEFQIALLNGRHLECEEDV